MTAVAALFVEALYEAAGDARRHVVVAARKAGVSWQDLVYDGR